MADDPLAVLAQVALPARNAANTERVMWRCPVCPNMLILANNKARHLTTQRHISAAESMGEDIAMRLCEKEKTFKI